MGKRVGLYTALLIFSFFSLSLSSCQEENPGEELGFNKNAFLLHQADEIILPAFQQLHTSANELFRALDSFCQAPDSVRLMHAREIWWNTYRYYLGVSAFNFGPAAAEGLQKDLSEEIAIFPIDAVAIEQKIESRNFALNDFKRDSRGLLTIEYLLFHNSVNQTIEDFNSSNRRDYTLQVSTQVKERIFAVLQRWNSSYRQAFISNNGSGAGSSVSLLYNAFVQSFEATKNFRLGVPLGLRAGQNGAEPQRVECLYSGKGAEALQIQLKTLYGIYEGQSLLSDHNSLGFKAYLLSVYGGPQLVNETEASYENIVNQLNELNRNSGLDVQIQTDPLALKALHTSLQKHTRFFKSDMSSLLGIAITYVSGDGD